MPPAVAGGGTLADDAGDLLAGVVSAAPAPPQAQAHVQAQARAQAVDSPANSLPPLSNDPPPLGFEIGVAVGSGDRGGSAAEEAAELLLGGRVGAGGGGMGGGLGLMPDLDFLSTKSHEHDAVGATAGTPSSGKVPAMSSLASDPAFVDGRDGAQSGQVGVGGGDVGIGRVGWGSTLTSL